ncbi:Uncharacterised protein [Mycobacteroides abscessus subsp. abscessus]|nr:Uncharacterised protein [Mycobacteroides abscessus subsp. abscessus]
MRRRHRPEPNPCRRAASATSSNSPQRSRAAPVGSSASRTRVPMCSPTAAPATKPTSFDVCRSSAARDHRRCSPGYASGACWMRCAPPRHSCPSRNAANSGCARGWRSRSDLRTSRESATTSARSGCRKGEIGSPTTPPTFSRVPPLSQRASFLDDAARAAGTTNWYAGFSERAARRSTRSSSVINWASRLVRTCWWSRSAGCSPIRRERRFPHLHPR